MTIVRCLENNKILQGGKPMRKKFNSFIVICIILFIYGCAAKLSEQSQVNPYYSIADVQTYSVTLDCSKTSISGLQANFVENYCPILESNIKLFLQRQNPTWFYSKINQFYR